MEKTKVWINSKGDSCVICQGEYPFPSENAMGLYPEPKKHPKLFICWECVFWLSKKLNRHINGKGYNFVFSSSRSIRDL